MPKPCPHAFMPQFAPPWFQRDNSKVNKKGLKDVYVNFAVACSSCNKKQQTMLAKAQTTGAQIIGPLSLTPKVSCFS